MKRSRVPHPDGPRHHHPLTNELDHSLGAAQACGGSSWRPSLPFISPKQPCSEIGNTAFGVGAKHSWAEYYQPDGTIRGRTDDGTNDGPYRGKWTVSGSEMCFNYDDSGDVGCWAISVEGDEITYSKEGDHDVKGTLLKGNPKNL